MRNETAPNPVLTEVYSQVLSATAVPQGTPLRLSAVGKRATDPRASYATSGGERRGSTSSCGPRTRLPPASPTPRSGVGG